MSLDYAGEMLDRAVYLLAVGVDRIQGRLDDAWAQALTNVPRLDLPEDLGAVFDDIRGQLLSVVAAASETRRLRPVGSLSDEQAADVARTILSLAFQVRSAIDGHRGSVPGVVDDPKRWQRRSRNHPAGS
jgi:hypothetical protein